MTESPLNAPRSAAPRKRSCTSSLLPSVTTTLTGSTSNSAATLLLRHRLLQRSSYGVLAQCAAAATVVLSPSSSGSITRAMTAVPQKKTHSLSSGTSSLRPTMQCSPMAMDSAYRCTSRALSSLSQARTLPLRNNRLVELILASLVGLVTSASLAFTWYDGPASTASSSNHAASVKAATEPSSQSKPRVSLTRRTNPGAAMAATQAANVSPNKAVAPPKTPYDVSFFVETRKRTTRSEYEISSADTHSLHTYTDFRPRHSRRPIHHGRRVLCRQWRPLCRRL